MDGAALQKRGKKEKLNNIQKTNESSKVTSFKDEVSCITEMEACFTALSELLWHLHYCHLSFLPRFSASPLILHNPLNSHP